MVKRRRFLQLAGLGSISLACSIQGKLQVSKFSRSQPLTSVDLQNFEYETPEINRKGQLVGLQKLSNQFFLESLDSQQALNMVAVPSSQSWVRWVHSKHRNFAQARHTSAPAFFISQCPITQAQWAAVAALPKVKRELDPAPSHFQGSRRPVESISWLEAVEFCVRLSHLTGRTYQLPTEAQWEQACRAGSHTPFHTGATITSEWADYVGTYTYAGEAAGTYRRQTLNVGSFAPNAFGLHDMHGNVWEWCADRWQRTDARNTLAQRSIRGGGWLDPPERLRSASRSGYDPNALNRTIGFRVMTVLS